MRNPFVRLLVLAAALSIALGAATQTSPHAATSSAARLAQLDAISDYRAADLAVAGTDEQAEDADACTASGARGTPTYLRWVRELWRGRAAKAHRLAQHPPHRREWLCIHRYERHPGQGWATRTGNGYYGGLQMDISFQRTYGGELCGARGPRTAGRRPSRCGSPSAPTGAAAASTPGRTRPATAA